jgi:hypothetical protein
MQSRSVLGGCCSYLEGFEASELSLGIFVALRPARSSDGRPNVLVHVAASPRP